MIFTFGTAWVYRYLGTSALVNPEPVEGLSDQKNQIVANCHKLPQQNFKKELLSIEEILKSIQNMFEKISEINPNAIIIKTVSPVRHIKDGFAENSLSKAHLISAIHNFKNQKSLIVNRQSKYFPSFEIVMDELRDYRFYTEDLLHPNKTAIEIIWKKFSQVWIASETELLQKEIASVQHGLNHKPFNPESAAHLQFLETLRQKMASITKQYPHIHF